VSSFFSNPEIKFKTESSSLLKQAIPEWNGVSFDKNQGNCEKYFKYDYPRIIGMTLCHRKTVNHKMEKFR